MLPLPPLVVDLDGTLLRSDLLHESANQFVTKFPGQVARILLWLAHGRCFLKLQLAQRTSLDPALLPYNQELITWLRAERKQGRTLILATASHHTLAESVAKHLDLFDEVLATEVNLNLKGRRKRDLLVQRFGIQGFDYIGDCAADLPVWAAARKAYLVGNERTLRARLNKLGNLAGIFDHDRSHFVKPLVAAMRPHQWLKNLLVVVPLLTAHQYTDGTSLFYALLAFAAFSFAASSVYILNDLVDVESDRKHHRKSLRPFAAGRLSLAAGWIAWPIIVVAAFAIAGTLSLTVLVYLLAYFMLTVAYSLHLKKLAVVDVLTLAMLYTMRIVVGAAAIEVSLSFWLLTFSMFMFVSLAFVKRFTELQLARRSGDANRLPGRGYMQEDLEIVASMGVTSGFLSILVLALYIQDSNIVQFYQSPRFIWLACPLLLFWVSHIWLIAHRGQMHDDPLVFAIRDRASWTVAMLVVLSFGLARAIT